MSKSQKRAIEDEKKDFAAITEKLAQQQISLNKHREELKKLDKCFAAKEKSVKTLELLKERENDRLEAFVKMTEEKHADALTFFEKQRESKQEKNAIIEKLMEEERTVKSEVGKVEELLNECKGYQNVLLKVMNTERQEAPEAETFKAQVLSNLESFEIHETTVTQGLETSPDSVPSSDKKPTLSSAPSNTLVTDSNLESDIDSELQLYFSEPHQLMDLLSKMTDQNLSLVQNATRIDKKLEETIEITRKKMDDDEEKLTLQINDMKDRIDKETDRGAILRKKVLLHDSLKAQDQDIMLQTLAQKVATVHSSVDKRLTNLSTLEKLASIENRASLLLEEIESIPQETLHTLRCIKDKERRSRLRQEELRLEMEKQAERMKKCIKRSQHDTKKTYGRKLMPRCIPVKQRVQATEEAIVEDTEEDNQDYLFKDDSD
ncbi:cilia- and flagella-associated protein 100-like [Mugil cephalus]|uniref:cilia- and flagella-associated protein 100-like n=1 Tax=Mugil cephalus TaxID=48193 RepID=UPI001FB69076|nr:cilia- and flagella-associated protein 100-like [Mugil cephalus]